MTPVAFETVSTHSSYEAAFSQPDFALESSHSMYSTSTSKGEFLKIFLDYQSRGLRIVSTATRSMMPSMTELRATFAALGFDYDPTYDFSNASAAAIAQSATPVDEDSLVGIDLPPA